MMKINVGPPLDGELSIDISANPTIMDVKAYIYKISTIPTSNIKIFRNNIEMANTVSTADFANNSTDHFTCIIDEQTENNNNIRQEDIDKKVDFISNMGYQRENVIKALKDTNYKTEDAISLLKSSISRQRADFTSKKEQHSNKISHDRSKHKEKWTSSDDEKLLDLYLKVSKTSIKWSFIQQYFPNCSTSRLEKKFNKIIKKIQQNKSNIKMPPALLNDVFGFVDINLHKSNLTQSFDRKVPINVIKLILSFNQNKCNIDDVVKEKDFNSFPKGYLIYLIYWIHINLNIFVLPSNKWSLKEIRILLDRHYNNNNDQEIASQLKKKDNFDVHDKIKQIKMAIIEDIELTTFAKYFENFEVKECEYNRDDIPVYVNDLLNKYLNFENDKLRLNQWSQATNYESEIEEDLISKEFQWNDEMEMKLLDGVEEYGSTNSGFRKILKKNEWEFPIEEITKHFKQIKTEICEGKKKNLIKNRTKLVINPFKLVKTYLAIGNIQSIYPFCTLGYLRYLLFFISSFIASQKVTNKQKEWTLNDVRVMLEMSSDGESDSSISERLNHKFDVNSIVDKKLEIVRQLRSSEMKKFVQYGENAAIPNQDFEIDENYIPIYFIKILEDYNNRNKNIVNILDVVDLFKKSDNNFNFDLFKQKFPENNPGHLLFIFHWLVFSLNKCIYVDGWSHYDIKQVFIDYYEKVDPELTRKKLLTRKTADEIVRFRTQLIESLKKPPNLEEFMSSVKFDVNESEYDFLGIPSYLRDAVSLYKNHRRVLEGAYKWTKENEQLLLTLFSARKANWEKISQNFPNCQLNDLKNHFKELKSEIENGNKRNFEITAEEKDFIMKYQPEKEEKYEENESIVVLKSEKYEIPKIPTEAIDIKDILMKLKENSMYYKKLDNYKGLSSGYIAFLVFALMMRCRKYNFKRYNEKYYRMAILMHYDNVNKRLMQNYVNINIERFLALISKYNKKLLNQELLQSYIDVAETVKVTNEYSVQGVPVYFDLIGKAYRKIVYDQGKCELNQEQKVLQKKFQKTEKNYYSDESESERKKAAKQKKSKKNKHKKKSSDDDFISSDFIEMETSDDYDFETKQKRKPGQKKSAVSSESEVFESEIDQKQKQTPQKKEVSDESDNSPSDTESKEKTEQIPEKTIVSSDSDNSESEVEVKQKKKPGRKKKVVVASSDSDSDVEQKPKKRGRPKRVVSSDSDDSDSEVEVEVKPKKRGRPKRIVSSDSDNSESEVEVEVKPKKRGRPKRIISSDSDDSESEVEVKPKKRGRPKRIISSDSDDSDSEVEVEIKPPPPPPKRKRGRPRKNPIIASDESEDQEKRTQSIKPIIKSTKSLSDDEKSSQQRDSDDEKLTSSGEVKYWTKERDQKLVSMHNKFFNDSELWNIIKKEFPEVSIQNLRYRLYTLRLLSETNQRRDLIFSHYSNEEEPSQRTKQAYMKSSFKSKTINVCSLVKTYFSSGRNVDSCFRNYSSGYSKGYVIYVLFWLSMKLNFRPFLIKDWTMREIRVLLEKSYEGIEYNVICEYLNKKTARRAEMMRKLIPKIIMETKELHDFIVMFDQCDSSNQQLDHDDIPLYVCQLVDFFNSSKNSNQNV
ncbi:AT hook motif family protein [Trichomonas vaginalis G3]|uniref:AT hook motif family protein n=1 Tax=Trichomonas vaginalis (strain ATCC PRA-98 / G3) TaxID=412133 RepID=A2EA66_TRIV3|nr:4.1 G protein family [Trichomonas vaginalis G3]EAY10406.1 AT hook motif family protein [Trichomonas vaginalis G3]KAI5548307.1 4.1 G protein family [Trichomonas vaginalis G3]|eukprot:XP_001322629.1 AT hook motif family protein [Trichomonas vaginalis G3]